MLNEYHISDYIWVLVTCYQRDCPDSHHRELRKISDDSLVSSVSDELIMEMQHDPTLKSEIIRTIPMISWGPWINE